MNLKHSLTRLGALLVLAASIAVVSSATVPSASAFAWVTSVENAYQTANTWQQSAYPGTRLSPTPTWGCYLNDPVNRDPSRFEPAWNKVLLVFGDWKPQSSGREGSLWGPTWGCYPAQATPDPSGFTPDPSGFIPNPYAFTPLRDALGGYPAQVAVAIPGEQLVFLPHTGN